MAVDGAGGDMLATLLPTVHDGGVAANGLGGGDFTRAG